MDEFIAEIKEEVRRDRLIEIWNQYGNHIIGGVLAILLITAGYVYWVYHTEKRNYRDATQYEEALKLSQSGQIKEAKDKFTELMATASMGYKILAGFELAKLKINNDQEAQEIYLGMLRDTKIPEVYRQLAFYKYMATDLNTSKIKNLDVDLKTMLNKSPWLPSIKELQALSFLKDHQDEKAHALFVELLQGQDTPSGLRLRALGMVEEVK